MAIQTRSWEYGVTRYPGGLQSGIISRNDIKRVN